MFDEVLQISKKLFFSSPYPWIPNPDMSRSLPTRARNGVVDSVTHVTNEVTH